MARFYTNVTQKGNQLWVRECDNGVRSVYQVDFQPTVWMTSNSPKAIWKTLEGKSVYPIQPGTINDTREYIKQHQNVVGQEIYESPGHVYQYITEQYPNEIEWTPENILIFTIDIETSVENGFPNPIEAIEQILLITLHNKTRNKFITWGSYPYNNERKDVEYRHCQSEPELLRDFLSYWTLNFPDVITGWNCIPVTQSIWTKTQICQIQNLNENSELYDSNLIHKFPVSNKTVYQIKLANGMTVKSSKDHIFRVREVTEPHRYVNLKITHKNKGWVRDIDITAENMKNTSSDIYCFLHLRDNCQPDISDISDELLYIAGLLYTDGTVSNKSQLGMRFKLYQSDLEFMENLSKIGFTTKITGPHKNNYMRTISFGVMKSTLRFWLDSNNSKRLSLEELSKLSKRQFLAFLSGLLDGDGCIVNHFVSWCNFNGDINTLSELCLWNGIMITIQEHLIRFQNLPLSQMCLRKFSRWGKNSKKISQLSRKRTSLQRSYQNKWRDTDDPNKSGVWVRVIDVVETDQVVPMMDINTDTNLFVTKGITTHNCSLFDLTYLYNRMVAVLGQKYADKLSPCGVVHQREIDFGGRTAIKTYPKGIAGLDYLDLYKKFIPAVQESYKLDYIVHKELGKNKLKNPGTSFKDFYQNFWDTFVTYNIIDTELVSQLDDKMKLIELAITIAYNAKINYDDVFSPVKTWDVIIYNYLNKINTVIPSRQMVTKSNPYGGGYVKEPLIGKHKWVCSQDLNSLYPNLIIMYNMSPETITNQKLNVTIEGLLNQEYDLSLLVDKNYTMASNGCCFDRSKLGMMPYLMQHYYDKRVEYKKMMLNTKQQLEEVETELRKRKGRI